MTKAERCYVEVFDRWETGKDGKKGRVKGYTYFPTFKGLIKDLTKFRNRGAYIRIDFYALSKKAKMIIIQGGGTDGQTDTARTEL